MPKPIIIDCDPGVDDALAILLALASKKLDVKLITTCAGNQTIEKTTKNTLDLLDFIGVGQEIEVAQGATKPMERDLVVADAVHGENGFGGVQLPKSNLSASDRSALEAMRDTILKSKEKVTIVAIGPLTNVALLVKTYPELIDRIQQLSVMGGACCLGNITPVAEFNIYVDPEAAQLVYQSGIPIKMFGLDVTHQVPLFTEDIDRIANLGNETGKVIAQMLKFYGKADFIEGLHDPCAVAYLLDPSLFTFATYNVEVETMGEFTRGQTVVDLHNNTGKYQNVDVAYEVNRDKMIDTVCWGISKFK